MYKTASQIAGEILKYAVTLPELRKITSQFFQKGQAIRGAQALSFPAGMGVVRKPKRIPVGALKMTYSVPTHVSQTDRVSDVLGKRQFPILASGPLTKIISPLGSPFFDPRHLRTPAQKELANRIGLLHERLEQAALRKIKFSEQLMKGWDYPVRSSAAIAGHASPHVLLQEGNILASLPRYYGGVGKMFREARTAYDPALGALQRHFPGYTHGVTRLSRHARRRIAENIARESREEYFKGIKRLMST